MLNALRFYFYSSRSLFSVAEAITVDTHADTPSEFMSSPFDLGVWNTRGHFVITRG